MRLRFGDRNQLRFMFRLGPLLNYGSGSATAKSYGSNRSGSATLLTGMQLPIVEGLKYTVPYIEHQSFCPFIGIGSPHPLQRENET
jgi:hypothetical protein